MCCGEDGGGGVHSTTLAPRWGPSVTQQIHTTESYFPIRLLSDSLFLNISFPSFNPPGGESKCRNPQRWRWKTRQQTQKEHVELQYDGLHLNKGWETARTRLRQRQTFQENGHKKLLKAASFTFKFPYEFWKSELLSRSSFDSTEDELFFSSETKQRFCNDAIITDKDGGWGGG